MKAKNKLVSDFALISIQIADLKMKTGKARGFKGFKIHLCWLG